LLTVDWSPRPEETTWQLGGPSLAGGDTLLWLLGLLAGRPVPAAAAGARLERLLAGPRRPEPVLFLPFLQGERVPFWDAALRGAMLGLGRRHGPVDLAFAALEGIACLNRMVLDGAEAASGARVAEIRLGGGGAASPALRRIKADFLRRPVVTVPGEERGLAGAAVMAWTALGRWPTLAAAQEALVPAGERTLPDPATHDRSERLCALFREACGVVNPLSRRLAAGWLPTDS
jgi:xylulokinase